MTYDELNEYILNYLENDKTKSAIMLTGGWGTGKSYYIEHNLCPFIKKKNKDCVVVSLYGLQELSEISKAIYFELRMNNFLDKLDKEVLKTGWVIAKTVAKGVSSFFGVDLSKDEESLQKLYESVNLSGKLVVLEDVERSSIDIVELLGYVNNLTEYDNVKILLVSNEEEFVEVVKVEHKDDLKGSQKIKAQFDAVYDTLNEIRNSRNTNSNLEVNYSDKTKKYLNIKEKTISDTLVFENDLNKTVSEIICDFKNRNLDEFSDENTVNELLNIYVKEKFNLRTLIFACQKTVNMFNKLPEEILKDNDFCKTVFFSIVYFSFYIKTAGRIPEWDGDEYCSRVLGTDNYPLYFFCYLYIKGQVLYIESAERSLKHFTKNKLFFSDAFYQNNDIDIIESYYWHSKEDVLKSLDALTLTLQDNTIPFTKYGTVIRSLVRFHKLFNYDYSQIKNLMKKWVNEYADDIDPKYKFGLLISSKTFEFIEDKSEYEEFIEDLLDVVGEKGQSNTMDFDYCPESVLEFSREISQSPYMYNDGKGFLSKFDVDKLFNMIKKCNSSQLYQLQTMFVKIYANNDPDMYGVDNIVLKEKFEIDLEPLKLLSKKIEQLTSTYSDDEIVGEWYDRLNKYLKRIISIIESED